MIKAFFIYCVLTTGQCYTEYVVPAKNVKINETNCLIIATEYLSQQQLDLNVVRIERVGCER